MRNYLKYSLIFLLSLISFSFAQYDVPNLISYQGYLSRGGLPYSGLTNFDIEIRTGGSAVWTTNLDADVVVGVYNLRLAIPYTVLHPSNQYMLRIRVGGSLVSPDVQLLSVPFAYYASSVHWSNINGMPPEFADGYDDVSSDWSSFSGGIFNTNGNVGIGTNAADYLLDVRGTLNADVIRLGGLALNSWPADGHSLDAADGSPVDALFVDNSGNVGIGTAPGFRLDVLSSSGTLARFRAAGTGNDRIQIMNDSGYYNLGIGNLTKHAYVYSSTGDFYIGSDGNPSLYVDGMTDGNVGIQTESPVAPLEVAGTGTIALNGPSQPGVNWRNSGALRFSLFTINSSGDTLNLGRYNNSGVYQNSPFIVNRSTGNIGMGGINPGSYRVSIAGGAAGLSISGGNDGDRLLEFDTDRPWYFEQEGDDAGTMLRLREYAAASKSFYVDASGLFGVRSQDGSIYKFIVANNSRVGIGGVTAPAHELHVAGSAYPTVYISSSDAQGGQVYLNSSVGNAAMYLNNDDLIFWNNGSDRMTIDQAGNVGIGIAPATYKFRVEGTGYFSQRLSLREVYWIEQSDPFPVIMGGSWYQFCYDNELRFRINSGMVSPSYYDKYAMGSAAFYPLTSGNLELGRNGNLWEAVWSANGTIQTSDRRLKENIKDLDYGLEEILDLKPVSFSWKTDPTERRLGLIAQDLQEIIPEMVYEGKHLAVNYSELIPVLIRGMQEQQKKIEDLELQVQELKR